MKWLHTLKLSAQASAVRARLSVAEFQHIERAIEHLSLATDRQLVEVADRVLISVDDMVEGEGSGAFLELLGDVIEDAGL